MPLVVRKPVRCKRCGTRWIPRVRAPKRCPRCLSYRWQTKLASKEVKL